MRPALSTFLRVALLVGTSVVLAMVGHLFLVGTLLLSTALLATSPILGLIGTVGGWLGTGWYIGRRATGNWAERFSGYRLGWPSGPVKILSGLFGSAGLVSVGILLLSALLASHVWEPGSGIGAPIVETTSSAGFDWVLVAFYLVAVGPLLEEAVFRAWLQPQLEAVLPAVPAILLAAIVFSALHVQYWRHPEMLLVSLCLGALAGWVSHATWSVWTAFGLHAFWNAAALILFAARPTISGVLSPAAELALAAAGLAALVCGAVLLFRASVRLANHRLETRLGATP